MLNKVSEKIGIKENILKGILIVLILSLMLVFIIFSSNKKGYKIPKKDITKEELIALFDKVNNNYTLEIEKSINNKMTNIEYSTDANVVLYEIDSKGYLEYQDNYYEVDADTVKLTKIDKEKINDNYYDIRLIKNIIKYCHLEYVNNAKSICSITYSDYINEYNLLFNTNIELTYDNIMKFEIVHYPNRIVKVLVDYSGINKIINYDDKIIHYGIKISNVDENDFSKIIDYFKDELNK